MNTSAPSLTDLFRAYLAAHEAMAAGAGSSFASREARRAVTARIREVASLRSTPTFTATEYDGERVAWTNTSTDYNSLHRDLIARGYTCSSQSYATDDSVTGAQFGHTLNAALSARISS